jgi:hypothetical protein
VEKKMKVKIKIKWPKFSLFCISALLATSAHCNSTDILALKAAPLKSNIEQTAKPLKTPPQTREDKIKTMVETNDNQAKNLQAEMENKHHKNRIMKKNCSMAKNQLQNLMTHPRVKIKQQNGSMKYMTPTEKTQKMKETRQAIKRYCGQES